MVRYHSRNVVKSCITPSDIDYLRRQILTGRAVNSEGGINTDSLSSLYEAAKTLLTVIEHTLSIFKFNSIEIRIEEKQIESPTQSITSAEPVYSTMDSYVQIVLEGFAFVETNYVNAKVVSVPIRGILEFTPPHTDAISTSQNNYLFHILFVDARTDIPDESRSKYEQWNQRNPNMILSYQDNFPMPTVFVEMIQSEFIFNIKI